MKLTLSSIVLVLFAASSAVHAKTTIKPEYKERIDRQIERRISEIKNMLEGDRNTLEKHEQGHIVLNDKQVSKLLKHIENLETKIKLMENMTEEVRIIWQKMKSEFFILNEWFPNWNKSQEKHKRAFQDQKKYERGQARVSHVSQAEGHAESAVPKHHHEDMKFPGSFKWTIS